MSDPSIAQYRALSGLAVAGLALAVLSPTAVIDPVLWIVPLAATVTSDLALWRIAARAPALTGRRLAIAGLVLGVCMGVAAPTDWLAYRWALRREARQFALDWFAFLADDQPQKAHQLVLHPQSRQAFDDKLWSFYREEPRWRDELKNYADQPVVRTLLALGKKAHARYCETVDQSQQRTGDTIAQLYAVTYDDAGRKKTFFVLLYLERFTLGDGRANWRLERAEAGKME